MFVCGPLQTPGEYAIWPALMLGIVTDEAPKPPGVPHDAVGWQVALVWLGYGFYFGSFTR